MNPATTFDSQNPKYKCFFGKLHVSTATKWICYFYFALTFLGIGCIIYLEEFRWSLYLAILVGLFIEAFIFGTPLYAVNKEKPKWLFPYLIASVLCTIFDGYCIGYDLVNKSYEDAWILADFADFVINIWFITIFYNCYQYLTAKNNHNILPMSFSNKISTMPLIREDIV